MTTTANPRQAAAAKIDQLTELLKSQPSAVTSAIVEECEALSRAVAAFHLEGIRFRIFNVDRLIGNAGAAVPSAAPVLLEEARRLLEAAGFHTRSHQAPS